MRLVQVHCTERAFTVNVQLFNCGDINAVILDILWSITEGEFDFNHFLNVISSLNVPKKFCLEETNPPKECCNLFQTCPCDQTDH